MDRFIQLSDKEKRIAFRKADEKLGISEDIIEKDFWVCWILKELFLMDGIKENLTFKGGTSLSKIFGLIKRFSEDIDISVERSYFGFVDEKELMNVSKKKAKNISLYYGNNARLFE